MPPQPCLSLVPGPTRPGSDALHPSASAAAGPGVVRIELQLSLSYRVGTGGADFAFNVHAARTARQHVRAESLTLEPAPTIQLHEDVATGNRSLRLHADPGPLQLVYEATVDLAHRHASPAEIRSGPIRDLPPSVMGYLYPSRYCPSDRMVRLAQRHFGHLAPGYQRVMAIRDWVRQHVSFTPHSSNANTSAIDTLVDTVGVCRDFAHLMIAMCRAMSIPARFTTGTDFGADPALGPPDFHAYVEVYLDDAWFIFDPSGTAIPMGFVRLGTGRDAADVPVTTIFGAAVAEPPVLSTRAVVEPTLGLVEPVMCDHALSTDDGADLPA